MNRPIITLTSLR